jgi:hypothetical protein
MAPAWTVRLVGAAVLAAFLVAVLHILSLGSGLLSVADR